MKKVGFYSYKQEFKELFQKEKEKIEKALPEAEVFHVGSTAVADIGGKGIIDILVGLPDWEKREKAVKTLKGLGFTHVHPEKEGRIFLSRRARTGYTDTHIHLVEKGNAEYEKKLGFRDYLRDNPEQARKYHQVKKKAMEEAKGDRRKYANEKKAFIKKILEKAGFEKDE